MKSKFDDTPKREADSEDANQKDVTEEELEGYSKKVT